jgi:hypothetical protein
MTTTTDRPVATCEFHIGAHTTELMTLSSYCTITEEGSVHVGPDHLVLLHQTEVRDFDTTMSVSSQIRNGRPTGIACMVTQHPEEGANVLLLKQDDIRRVIAELQRALPDPLSE